MGQVTKLVVNTREEMQPDQKDILWEAYLLHVGLYFTGLPSSCQGTLFHLLTPRYARTLPKNGSALITSNAARILSFSHLLLQKYPPMVVVALADPKEKFQGPVSCISSKMAGPMH